MSSVHLSTFVHTKGNSLYFAQLPFHFFFNVKAKAWKLFCNNISRGFPGGPVVKNLFCQRRGHGFSPCFRKIPHAMKQQSASATATEALEL